MTSLGEGLAVGFGAMGAQAAGGAQGFTAFLKMYADRKAQEDGRSFQREMTDRNEQFQREMNVLKRGDALAMEDVRHAHQLEIEQLRLEGPKGELQANVNQLTARFAADPAAFAQGIADANAILPQAQQIPANSQNFGYVASTWVGQFGGKSGDAWNRAFPTDDAKVALARADLLRVGTNGDVVATLKPNEAVSMAAQNATNRGNLETRVKTVAATAQSALNVLSGAGGDDPVNLEEASKMLTGAQTKLNDISKNESSLLEQSRLGKYPTHEVFGAAQQAVSAGFTMLGTLRKKAASVAAQGQDGVREVLDKWSERGGPDDVTAQVTQVYQWLAQKAEDDPSPPKSEQALTVLRDIANTGNLTYTSTRNGETTALLDDELMPIINILSKDPDASLRHIAERVVDEYRTPTSGGLLPLAAVGATTAMADAANYLRHDGLGAISASRANFNAEQKRDKLHTSYKNLLTRLDTSLNVGLDHDTLLDRLEPMLLRSADPKRADVDSEFAPVVIDNYLSKLGNVAKSSRAILGEIGELSRITHDDKADDAVISGHLKGALVRRYRELTAKHGWKNHNFVAENREVKPAISARDSADRLYFSDAQDVSGHLDIHGIFNLLADSSPGGRSLLRRTLGVYDDPNTIVGAVMAQFGSEKAGYPKSRVWASGERRSQEADLMRPGGRFGVGSVRLSSSDIQEHFYGLGVTPSWEEQGRAGHAWRKNPYGEPEIPPDPRYRLYSDTALDNEDVRRAIIAKFRDSTFREQFLGVSTQHISDDKEKARQTASLNLVIDALVSPTNEESLAGGGYWHGFFWDSRGLKVSIPSGTSVQREPKLMRAADKLSDFYQDKELLKERVTSIYGLRDELVGALAVTENDKERDRLQREHEALEAEQLALNREIWMRQPSVIEAVDDRYGRIFRRIIFSNADHTAKKLDFITGDSKALDMTPEQLAIRFKLVFDRDTAKTGETYGPTPGVTRLVASIKEAETPIKALERLRDAVVTMMDAHMSINPVLWMKTGIPQPNETQADLGLGPSDYSQVFIDQVNHRIREGTHMAAEEHRLSLPHSRLSTDMRARLSEESWANMSGKPILKGAALSFLGDDIAVKLGAGEAR